MCAHVAWFANETPSEQLHLIAKALSRSRLEGKRGLAKKVKRGKLFTPRQKGRARTRLESGKPQAHRRVQRVISLAFDAEAYAEVGKPISFCREGGANLSAIYHHQLHFCQNVFMCSRGY